MAHLRDAKTSELIAEGTPLELVHLADELGKRAIVVGPGEDLPADAELIYDDVGAGFDPDAVRNAHAENLEGAAMIAKASSVDDAGRDAARATVKELKGLEAGARRAAKQAAENIDAAQDADRPTLEPVTLTVPE